MASTIDRVLIDDGVIKARQGAQLVRVTNVVQNDGTHPPFKGKVRCTAYRDTSYAFQSHYTAEVWSGSSWKGVISLNPQHPFAQGRTLEEICDRLLADAKLILL